MPVVPVLLRGTSEVLSYMNPGFRFRPIGISIGEADHPDQAWVAEIPAEFLDRITGLGYPDVTFYLMEQREFVNQVREVVEVTFAAMTDR